MAAEPNAATRDVAAVQSVVAAWGRQLARRWTLRRAARWVALLALIPLLAVVADHTWPSELPATVMRGLGLGWLGAGICAAGALLWAARYRRPSALFAGRQLERAVGVPHNALLNAISIGQSPDGAYALQSAARQASGALRRVAHLPSPSETLGSATRWAIVLVLSLWVVYGFLAPKSIWQSLLRFFGVDLAPPSATRIEWVRPGPGAVARAGEALEFEFAVRGRPVREVQLTVGDAGEGGAPRSIQLDRRDESGGAVHWMTRLAPHEVRRDIAFVCLAGDASCKGLVSVAPRPEIEALTIVLSPPAGRGVEKTTTERDLLVWPGTEATFELRANTALRDPVFIFQRGKPAVVLNERVAAPEARTRMSLDGSDASVARVQVMLNDAGTYRIEFADRWNTPFRDPHGYRVSLLEPAAAEGGDEPGEASKGEGDTAAQPNSGGEGGGSNSASANGDRPGMGAQQADGKGDRPSSAPAGEPAGEDGHGGGTSPDRDAGEPGSSDGEQGEGGAPSPSTPRRDDADNDDRTNGDPGGMPGESSQSDPESSKSEPEQPGAGGVGSERGDGDGAGTSEGVPGTPGQGGGAGRSDGSDAPDGMPPEEPRPDDAPPRSNGQPGAADRNAPSPNPGIGRPEVPNLPEMLARGETIPESALLDIGVEPEAARSFAGALRRAQEAARWFGARPVPRRMAARSRGDETTVQTGRGVAREARRGVGEPEESQRDALNRISPPSNQDVPPQLRGVLEAYYRSLAARRGE